MPKKAAAPSLGLDLEASQDCRELLGSGGLGLFKKGTLIGGGFDGLALLAARARLEI